jgi:hypothetical protein
MTEAILLTLLNYDTFFVIIKSTDYMQIPAISDTKS